MNEREAFESTELFRDLPLYAKEASKDGYLNQSLDNEYKIFCLGYKAALAHANVNEQSQAQQGSRDWKEDYADGENMYQCTCSICESKFYGYKRRVVCKVCDASQAQQSQWISVEERLPEMFQKVLGIYGGSLCAFMRIGGEDDEWCWAIGRNDLYDDFFYDADDDYQVTHWMPLPPAPEGEKE